MGWPRLLPGARPRHHRRRRAGEGLSRRRQHRAQHRDHPLQLPDARGREVLRRVAALCRDLSQDFDLNLLYSERGHFTLAHTDAACAPARWRAEVNKHLGVDSELIYPDDIAAPLPVAQPVGRRALSDPRRALPSAGRDRAARRRRLGLCPRRDARGVEIHQQTEVTGIDHRERHGERRRDHARQRSAPARCCRRSPARPRVVAKMAGFRLPIRTIPLQACVSEPLKPFLDQIIVSGSLHVYVTQCARGELVMGGSTDPYELHSTRSTLDFKEGLLGHMLELFPFLARGEGHAPVGRHGRHDAGLLARHGHDAGARLLHRCAAGAPGASRRRRSAARRMAHTVATGTPHRR